MTAHQETGLVTASPTWRHYFSPAFLVQYNLILLGGAALFALAAASLVPLGVGLALEVLWLGIGPSLPAFRRWVDARETPTEADIPSSFPAPEPGIVGLDLGYGSRILAMRAHVHEIAAKVTAPQATELGNALAKLPDLETRFVALCQGAQRLTRFLTETSQTALEQEVARLNAALSAENDLGVRLTIRQAINLAQRRANQRDRVLSARRAIDVELETIESSLAYLHSQALTLGPNLELAREIEALFDQLSAPAALEADLIDVLAPQGRQA